MHEDSEFVMKESVSLNLLAGFILLIVGLLVLFNIGRSYHADQLGIYKKMLLLSFIPAVFYLWKGWKNKTLLTINKAGIYRCGVLLTTWENFIEAAIAEEQVTGSFNDHLVLYVYFYVEGRDGCFKRTIKLQATRDQSEEAILVAIRYFSGRLKK